MPVLSKPEVRTTIVMLTDPGNEIDDEILLSIMMRNVKNCDVHITCVPGNSNTDASEAESEIQKRWDRVRELFPEEFGVKNIWSNKKPQNSSFILCELSELHKLDYVDYVFHIAPLWHIPVDTFGSMHIGTRIIMGDHKNPTESINLLKSIPKDCPHLTDEYHAQEKWFSEHTDKLISIPTSSARKVPLPYSIIESLPGSLSDPLLKTAFSQFTGRVDPILPWAKSISNVNHFTILNYLSDTVRAVIVNNNGLGTVSLTDSLRIKGLVASFLDNIENADLEYAKRLEDIAMTVELITKTKYVSHPFTKDNLSDPVLAENNWLEHIDKYNCDLTPAYDLLAWVVYEHGCMPSIDTCIKTIYRA